MIISKIANVPAISVQSLGPDMLTSVLAQQGHLVNSTRSETHVSVVFLNTFRSFLVATMHFGVDLVTEASEMLVNP